MSDYTADDSGYKDRYVAFLDILGFSQLTEKADQHPNWRAWLRDCITALKSTLPAKADHAGFRFVQFSDSIVISADRTPDGLRTVLTAVQMLYRNMLSRGILLRGGIAAGNFHHDDHLMFGPALIRAYAFEQNGAPPHVALHSAVIEDLKPSLISSDATYWFATDPWDSTPMLHVLVDFEFYDGLPREGGEELDRLAFFLARQIESNASDLSLAPSARSKWRWLQHYWNKTVHRAGILQYSGPNIDWNAASIEVERRIAARLSPPPPPVTLTNLNALAGLSALGTATDEDDP